MDGTSWILLDTETTGFKPPVFVVELAAQRMRGWAPDGPHFRRLLDHGIAIPPEAARVNGYTREILERDGEPPLAVYEEFATYVGNRPLVAYNLSYDLDQVLRPEWERLGIDPIGLPGFCALRLAQRLLDPVPAGNHKLQTLRQYYRLPQRGAHTALGDVETVVDLLQQILRPVAEERGLTDWEALRAFAEEPWFPSRIAFGKYKGRSFREAMADPDLHAWLEWLAASSNPRSATMGRWYLGQLRIETPEQQPESVVFADGLSDNSGLVIFRDPQAETLHRLIATARARLADLEAEYTQEHHAVEVVQAQLFALLRPSYARRDALRLKIEYRRRYLDVLLTEGEDEAEAVRPDYENARAESEREYEEAATQAAERQALSAEEEQELKSIYRQLVRLYHPDRFACDPNQQAVYQRLTQEINQARDRGDIERLREIAKDPAGFLMRKGWGRLDFGDDSEIAKLRQLHAALQERILDTLAELQRLRDSDEYELRRLSQRSPEFLRKVADRHAREIAAEIAKLEAEADRLAEEIESLIGAADPFSD